MFVACPNSLTPNSERVWFLQVECSKEKDADTYRTRHFIVVVPVRKSCYTPQDLVRPMYYKALISGDGASLTRCLLVDYLSCRLGELSYVSTRASLNTAAAPMSSLLVLVSHGSCNSDEPCMLPSGA